MDHVLVIFLNYLFMILSYVIPYIYLYKCTCVFKCVFVCVCVCVCVCREQKKKFSNKLHSAFYA